MGHPRTDTGSKVATCALLLAMALGCGGGSSPTPTPAGPPVPVAPGTRLGVSSAKLIGSGGGYVTSGDGVLTVSIPAGALPADVDVTIEVITNTAPSAVGNAYRIVAPAGTVFAAPVALVFTPVSSTSLADLSLATHVVPQDASSGFWVRQQGVTRDATAGTLTVTTTTLGDWAVVGLPTGRDLIGIFHVESTAGGFPVKADGKSAINFHSGDATTGWYLQSGELTAQSPLAAGGATCSPNAPTMSLAPNVAEVLGNPDRFRWAVDGHWDLTCSPPGPPLAYVSFDTTGINYLGCERGYVGTPPLITPEKLLGEYVINCGPGGMVTANWHFEICNLGEPCPSSNQCHTAAITCDTGLPLCVDNGNVPNGLACDLVAGVNEVCGDGVCNVCRLDEPCDPPANFCHVGSYTCDTGFEICTDTGAANLDKNGVTCDVDPAQPEVCGNGTCNVCYAEKACATNPNPCFAGTTSCTTGSETCVDTATPIAAGTACNLNPLVDEVCNGTGTCVACTAGLACSANSNVCVAGVTSCATGGETCENTATPIRTGLVCDVNPSVPEVCFNGVCNACTAGNACSTNPNTCVAGVTSCTTGQEVCVDTTTPIRTGLDCDVIPSVPEVCFNGACNACTAGNTCSTNPNICYSGKTYCGTGQETCIDDAQRANGTTCGTNMVCNGGTCSFCEAGLFCSTNGDPCLTGITSCATGTSQCVNNAAAPEPNGTVCGADQVCNTGACVSCTANLACGTNPDTLCHDGTTSCATGTSACVDGAAKANGTTCGANQVCNGGACVSCTAGLACSTNPDTLCNLGVTSCSTGTSVCVDGADRPNGTVCGADMVCSAGTCSSCTAGLACATNPDTLCNLGVTSCSTGTSACVDGADRANGTSCGTNLVCNAGTCSSCTAGDSCATNPDALCHDGVTSCATGASVCVDSTAKANGTTCGTNMVCNAGTCSSCTAGQSCSTNPDALCNLGVTSCATGTSVCVDGADRPNGTTCGADMVCSAGACSSCIAGLSCDTNPDTACNLGVTSCATGTSACVDGADRPNGTSCGTNLVCSAGACSSCIAGLSCDTNPDTACNLGVTSCATGTSVCVDGADRANGTSCGTNLVCSAGACSSCTAGLACATNADPCLGGKTSCSTGASVCVDDPLAHEADGTACGTNQVCSGGACTSCTAGLACDTNADPCLGGVTSCATGTSVCVDNPVVHEADGTVCGTDLVCNGGACVSCTAAIACDANPDPCLHGVTSCSTGTPVCVDNPLAPEGDGTICGAGSVCNAGVCSVCNAGLDCDTNPDPCLAGITSCSTGTQTCIDDTSTPEPNGTACGTNQVCSTGACVACTAGLACADNPNPCLGGVTSCATGTSVCVDNTLAPEPNGTACGANQVCNAGSCSSCTEGLACTANPDSLCHLGTTSCATGTQTCVDAAAKTDGTSCGTNLVCSAGACTSCTAGLACATNPDPLCNLGVTSCATGTSACVDGADRANGTSCGTNLVCSAGACASCSAGLACATNPNSACAFGATSCATGTETCVDAAAKPAGTTCGTNLVCSTAAACVPCTAGVACDTNADFCLGGTTSCSTGTVTCVDDPLAPEPNGTVCGTNLVCSGGACTSCTAGLACTTNPDPLCHLGTTSCATGAESCVNGAAKPAGTSCGTNLVCSTSATCLSCAEGAACTTNPDPCLGGTTSCSTGSPICLDNAAAPEPNGTSCGTNLVCNGGACASCVSAAACSTNPSPCLAGTTSCATGSQTCVDGTVPTASGTVCGTNQVCNAGACVACTSGLACTSNPGPCVAGTTSCSTGTEACVDTATPIANGTTCGTDQVCNAGSCVACTAGAACATNPDPCRTGTTSCATGTSVCTDSATPEPNGTSCGTDQVCNGGACVACLTGAACQNPGSCLAGTTSCATGASVCVDGTAPLADGTTCGASSLCQSGACVNVRTVSGTRKVTYWTTTGACTAAAPAACQSTVVAPDVIGSQAYVSARPAAGGTWAEIDGGTISFDGSFSIPNVPAGPYQLVLRLALGGGSEIVHVIETSSSDVDLGYDVLGRSDVTPASAGTNVTFDLTGLTAWLAEDEVEATAFDVDVFDVPVAGADVLTGQTVGGAIQDWSAGSAGRALALLAGTDVLHLHQLSTGTATDGVTAYAYQRATVSASASGYPLASGQPATVLGALAPMTDSGTVTVSWEPEQFEALLPALGPAATPVPNPHRLLVETAPYASLPAAPVAAYGTPQLFRMVRAHGGAEALAPISLAPITYGRFLDVALASEWRRAEFAATVPYTAPGATTPLDVLASVGRRDRMTPAPATPIVPAVGPVQAPLVAGQAALGASTLTGVTATPAISWSAPAIGAPTRYEVRILELVAQGTATTAVPVAALHVAGTGTSVAVPAGVLAGGKTYFAEITAILVADERFDVAPLRATQVFSHATTLTSPFTP